MDFGGVHLDQVQFLESILFESLGRETRVKDYYFLAGGCVNQSVQVVTDTGSFFVKWNETADRHVFEAEAQGLEILRQANEIGIPEVIGHGQNAQRNYLILEFLEFNQPKPDYWATLGESVARLHTHTQAQFGLAHDNFIGSLPQNNAPTDNWIDFFIERRLKPQAGLAMYNHAMPMEMYGQLTKFYARLPELLPVEKPALLHGDLWSGNLLTGRNGHACLIDPAVYYGHREAEMAFTRLFGGFEPDFYASYQAAFPLQPGFEHRIEIYNLYPLLVHVNLFGASYLPGIERVLDRFA